MQPSQKNNTYTASAVVAPRLYSQLSFNYPSLLRAVRNYVSRASGAVSTHILEDKFNIIIDAPVYPWPSKQFYEFQHLFLLPVAELTPDQRLYCDKYRALYEREQRRWKNFKRLERKEKVVVIDIQKEASVLEFEKCAREALSTLELNSKALNDIRLVYQDVAERIEKLQDSLELFRGFDISGDDDSTDVLRDDYSASSADVNSSDNIYEQDVDEFGWPVERTSTASIHGNAQAWESLLNTLGLSFSTLPAQFKPVNFQYG